MYVSGAKTAVGTGYSATASINSVTGGQANKNNYTLTSASTTFKIIVKTITITGVKATNRIVNATKTVKLDNDSLDFMDNNEIVAQVTDKQLYITNAEVTNQMKIGNILIKPSGIGGIMFIYE